MNSKAHLYISIIKSILRISGCILAMFFSNLTIMAFSFVVAEVGGVLEELFDKR
jgi:hypothetical protein